jgi:WD40 repeat protein
VYLYDTNTNEVRLLFDGETKTSVQFCPDAARVAIGCEDGTLYVKGLDGSLWQSKSHKQRIGVLEWFSPHVLATGSKDNSLVMHDIRKNLPVATLNNAQGEICSIKFSNNWMAAGDNANNINIFDVRKHNQLLQKYSTHKAAVKALAWSKHNSNILLSAGGLEDKKIKKWNIFHDKEVKNVDVNS